MKRASTFGLRLFTSAFLILFTFAQPLLAIESLTPVQDAATTVDESKDILPTGVSDPSWITSGESATTSLPVVEGITYEYPINPAVTVTFSKLPSTSSTLTIKTIYLTDEQVKATNAASNVAYDITTEMVDGTFKYDLTLPKTGDSKKVVYAENMNQLAKDNVKDISNVVDNGKSLKIEDLNHFTLFVVTLPNPVATDCSASGLTVSVGDRCYNTIQEAVDSAVDGDTIRVNAGTYVLNSVVNMDTPNVTLMGIGNPVIQVSGTGYRFIMSANGNTISGFNIQKTDKTGEQNIIWINANDVSITNNQISGQFVIGDPEVSRAMVISGGHSGLLIQNNTIHNLRQPAYISGVTTGNISNNYVYSTKGWVVEQGNMTFTNNTWGTGTNTNVYDIAILSLTNSSYYTNISAISEANNDAVIEDQRVSPYVLSDVYVDEGTAYTSDLGGRYHPYSSIVPALARVAAGGTIHLLSDVHVASRFSISKALTLNGNNHSLFSTFNKTDNSNNAAISIAHDDVILKNLTVDGISSTNLHGINIYIAKNILLDNVTVQNNDSAGIVVNGSTVTVNNITTSNNTWGGINVDIGGGVTSEAKLTVLGTSQHSEFKAIWMDDIRKLVSVIDTAGQYDSIDNGFTRILYLRIGTPTNLGWNVASKSTAPNETPLDLACSTSTVYTNENSVAQNWSSVSGLNIKYQREVTFPTGSISYFEAGSITNTPFSTFGSSTGIEGLWKTRVRAYIDTNSNNTLDSYEGRSQWSNYCNITLDKTAPAKSTGLSFSDKGNSEVKMCGAKTSSHVGAVIHWDASTDANFDYYEYRSFNADGSTGPLRTFTTNSFDASWWTVPMEGVYGFQVRAVDKAGNAGEWTDTCNIVEDWTAPDVTTTGIKYPNSTVVNKFVTNYNTPTIVGHVLSSDTASTDLTINSQTYDATINGTGWEANVTNIIPDGTYEMQIVATDDIGNSKTTTQTITIDTKAPTAVYTHYKDGVEVLGAQAFVQSVSQLSFTGAYTDPTPSSELYWDSFVIFQAQNDGSFAFAQNGKQAYCSWRQNPNLVELSGNPSTLTTQRQFTDCVATLPEGTYYMTHQVYDNATRKDIPTINQFRDVLGLKFTIDTTAPVSQFTPNQANTYHNSSILLQGVSNDVNGVTEVSLYYKNTYSSNWILIETQTNSSNSSTFNWSKTWTPPYQGTFDVKAEATDQAGNTEHSPRMDKIVYDTTRPSFGNINIEEDYLSRYVNGYYGFTISVRAEDSLSGIKGSTCEYTLNGSTWNSGIFINDKCRFGVPSFILYDNQSLDIRVRVNDKAGNTKTSTVVERKVDKALPQSEAMIANEYYGPNRLPFIHGVASDSVSQISDVKITMRRDSDGKYWTGNSLWSYLPGTQDVLGTSHWVLTNSLPAMSNGVQYTVTPLAWDQVQDFPGIGIADSFIWDSQNPIDPTVSSTSHTSAPNRDRTIDISFSGANDGDGSGVAGYFYSFSHTPETPSVGIFNWLPAEANHITSRPLSDGIWYFNIRTIDNVGNITSTAHSIPFVIDTTAPTTPAIISPTAEQYFKSTPILNDWTDATDVNGIASYRVEYKYDDGHTFAGGPYRTTTASQRSHTPNSNEQGGVSFRVQAFDSAGNEGAWSSWVHYYYDQTAPSKPVITNTTEFTNVNAITLNWTGGNDTAYVNSTGAGIAAYSVRYAFTPADGSADINWTSGWVSGGNPHTRSGSFGHGEGKYVIYVKTIDMAGNESPESDSYTITYDKTDSVTTASGIDNLWHNTDVTVNLTCDDASGSGCYQTFYSLNGASPYVQGNTVIVNEEGLNTIDFYSTDRAGNTENEQTSEVVKIDKTNPEAQILSALSFTTGDTTPRSLALSDNTELSQVCYVIDTNTQTCLPLFGTGYSWDITNLINTLSVGTHIFTYYVVDTAGNRSDSNTIIEGNDPYAASVVVAAVPQVRGATTVAEVTPEAVQGVQTTEEETTSPVTTPTEEVKGAQDTNEEETNGKPVPWWVYVIGGATLLSFIIFLIARRRKEEEEKEKNIR